MVLYLVGGDNRLSKFLRRCRNAIAPSLDYTLLEFFANLEVRHALG